mmetsp:Transcript_6367/g.23538  ORF Transcript_6367/g.23538 Transcript_6367/m.23538 type:complete len:1250 (+) Transcript_6367:645-4394(+)
MVSLLRKRQTRAGTTAHSPTSGCARNMNSCQCNVTGTNCLGCCCSGSGWDDMFRRKNDGSRTSSRMERRLSKGRSSRSYRLRRKRLSTPHSGLLHCLLRGNMRLILPVTFISFFFLFNFVLLQMDVFADPSMQGLPGTRETTSQLRLGLQDSLVSESDPLKMTTEELLRLSSQVLHASPNEFNEAFTANSAGPHDRLAKNRKKGFGDDTATLKNLEVGGTTTMHSDKTVNLDALVSSALHGNFNEGQDISSLLPHTVRQQGQQTREEKIEQIAEEFRHSATYRQHVASSETSALSHGSPSPPQSLATSRMPTAVFMTEDAPGSYLTELDDLAPSKSAVVLGTTLSEGADRAAEDVNDSEDPNGEELAEAKAENAAAVGDSYDENEGAWSGLHSLIDQKQHKLDASADSGLLLFGDADPAALEESNDAGDSVDTLGLGLEEEDALGDKSRVYSHDRDLNPRDSQALMKELANLEASIETLHDLQETEELDIATPGKEVAEQIDQLKRERDQLELLQIQQNDADLLALHHLHTKNVVEEAAKVRRLSFAEERFVPYECTLGCDGHGFHKRMFIANSTYELRQPLCSFVRAHTVFAGGDVVDEVRKRRMVFKTASIAKCCELCASYKTLDGKPGCSAWSYDTRAGLLTFRNCYFKDAAKVAIAAEFGLMSGSNSSSLLHIANETEYDVRQEEEACRQGCKRVWVQANIEDADDSTVAQLREDEPVIALGCHDIDEVQCKYWAESSNCAAQANHPLCSSCPESCGCCPSSKKRQDNGLLVAKKPLNPWAVRERTTPYQDNRYLVIDPFYGLPEQRSSQMTSFLDLAAIAAWSGRVLVRPSGYEVYNFSNIQQTFGISLTPFQDNWIDSERFAVGFHDCHKAVKRGAHACLPCSDFDYRTEQQQTPQMALEGLRHLFMNRSMDVAHALTSDLPLVWIATYKRCKKRDNVYFQSTRALTLQYNQSWHQRVHAYMKRHNVLPTPSPLQTSMLSVSKSEAADQVDTQTLVHKAFNPFSYSYVAIQLRTEKFDSQFFTAHECTDILMQAMNGTLRMIAKLGYKHAYLASDARPGGAKTSYTYYYQGKRDAIVKNERKKMDDGKKRDLMKRKMRQFYESMVHSIELMAESWGISVLPNIDTVEPTPGEDPLPEDAVGIVDQLICAQSAVYISTCSEETTQKITGNAQCQKLRLNCGNYVQWVKRYRESYRVPTMDTAQLINAHKKATQQIKMLKKRLKDNKHKDEHALIAPPYPVNFLV